MSKKRKYGTKQAQCMQNVKFFSTTQRFAAHSQNYEEFIHDLACLARYLWPFEWAKSFDSRPWSHHHGCCWKNESFSCQAVTVEEEVGSRQLPNFPMLGEVLQQDGGESNNCSVNSADRIIKSFGCSAELFQRLLWLRWPWSWNMESCTGTSLYHYL